MGFITLMCPNCNQPLEMDEKRDYGFCQYCGTKVAQEKVVVQHSGSVTIDNKELVEKFLANAHRALAKEDWEEVEKYYNLVEQNSPYNMEAVFFSAYGKAMLSLSDSDYFKREQKFNVLNNSMSVISDYYELTDENKEEILRKISNYIKKMYSVQFVYNRQALNTIGAIKAAAAVTGSRKWCINLFNKTKNTFFTELHQIAEKHNEIFLKELLEENRDKSTEATENKIPEQKKTKDKMSFRAIVLEIIAPAFFVIGVLSQNLMLIFLASIICLVALGFSITAKVRLETGTGIVLLTAVVEFIISVLIIQVII